MDEQRYFDRMAATWDDDPQKVARARQVGEAIAREVPDLARRRVLEYGAGTGLLGFALQARAARVTLADSSPQMLLVADRKIAAAEVTNMETRPLDLTRDPVPPERYDLVCSLLALHHVRDTDGLLRAFHELLAPGGVLCLADLDREDGSYHDHGAIEHAHDGFDRATLARSIEAAGFERVRFQTAFELDKRGRRYTGFLAVAGKPAGPA